MILPHLILPHVWKDLQKNGLDEFSWSVICKNPRDDTVDASERPSWNQLRPGELCFPHFCWCYISTWMLWKFGEMYIRSVYNRLWVAESSPLCWNGRISKYLKSHQECCWTKGFYRSYGMHHKVSLQIIYNWKVNACDCQFHTIYYNQLAKLKF